MSDDSQTETLKCLTDDVEECWLRYQRENDYPQSFNNQQLETTSQDYEIEDDEQDDIEPHQIISLMEELDEEENNKIVEIEHRLNTPEEVFEYMLSELNK